MPGGHSNGVPVVVRSAGYSRGGIGAFHQTRTARRIPLLSVQNSTSFVPAAQPERRTSRGDRAANSNVRGRVDVPASRDVRIECTLLVGAADPRGGRGAL